MNKKTKLANALRSIAINASTAMHATAGKVTAVAMTAVPGAAFAQDMAAGVTSAASEGSPQLWTIGGIVVGICAIGFLISRGKKSAS